MLYELREYTAVPGRLPRLIRRFNDVTVELFREHGMDLVFLSRTDLGENSKNELVYVLRFPSYAEMERCWAAFFADPRWISAAAESEVDGPLVASVRRRMLTTADFTGVS